MVKILLVEDEPRIAESIKKFLSSNDYLVDITPNSDQALKLLKKNTDYALLIIDVRLEGSLDGIELSRQIRANETNSPILILTALGAIKHKVSGLNAGADDYLVKPFAMNELLARVNRLLKRPTSFLKPIIKIDDLEINTETKQVSRSNKLIKLTKKEYDMLYYLARNQNQIISKQEIIDHLWSENKIIVPNTIEVYVGYLRQKIDLKFVDRPPLIQTIRGFGYKLGREPNDV
jgi:DNA-binding response OmpR family regulator